MFKNLDKYLSVIKKAARRLDPDARVFLFGSVTQGEHVYSSDIDVLVLSKAKPGEVLAELWRAGIKEPFEIHAETADRFLLYKGGRLVEV